MIRTVAAEDRRTVIVGATAPEIVKLIEAINSTEKHPYRIEGFLDDNPERAGATFMGYSVLGPTALLSGPYRDFCVVNNVGSTTAARKRVWHKMRAAGASRFPVLAHPGVDLGRVEVGEGTVIQEGCILGPNVKIGSHCLLTFGAVIAHDSCLADVICTSPRVIINSWVNVREGAFLGAGCIVTPQRTVAEWSIVGVGSTVIEDVPAHSTVFGCPARIIARRSPTQI